jgi:type I restriction enzyme M protein
VFGSQFPHVVLLFGSGLPPYTTVQFLGSIIGFPDKRFDYMLANPPFGVSWKQQERFINQENISLGYDGRFGAGLPRVNDGALLFLQHMISKMRTPKEGGSRIGIVFNGSPLFTGDAGSGESEIRRWIIEHDWLDAIVAMPDQLFYNTGISTYIWIVTNRKTAERKGKIQLIDARQFFVKMRKSLGNKRNQIGDGEENRPDQIAEITKIYNAFKNNEKRKFVIEGKEKSLIVSKIFENPAFGFNKITVERPLRMNFQASQERISRLEEQPEYKSLATSKKKNTVQHVKEVEEGKKRQAQIKKLLSKLDAKKLYKNRKTFLSDLKKLDLENKVFLTGPELKAVLSALGERSDTADICTDRHNQPEADTDLRDTETVPLTQDIQTYFKKEVLPHVPDAWIDPAKTKIGYELPFNRHFYVYEPPRPLEEIETDIQSLEKEILALLKEVTA